MIKLNIVILAAGKGTRMNSNKPKVLHHIGDKSILAHVIDSSKALKPNKIIVVYGYGGDEVKEEFKSEMVIWVNQQEQYGTGHAVLQTIPHLDLDAITLILLGDVPLISIDDCNSIIKIASRNKLGILSFNKKNPTGYGRILRSNNNHVIGIIEHKDASNLQREITEVNTGIMALPNKYLEKWITQITNVNTQNEYYLTDIVAIAVADNIEVTTKIVDDEWSVTGINSKLDLTQIERIFQNKLAYKLLEQGVTIKDVNRIDIRGSLSCGMDNEIDVNCIFEGIVKLGDNVKISSNCVIINATIASGSFIAPFTHIDNTIIGENNRIGPYARLRPGTILAADIHIGNFVEIKNSIIDSGSKINHLSYIGDSTIGKSVNIGAGTITCNYDGVNKYRTIVEDNVFIGSDTQLIAPVTIGKGATIAAGSTITKNAPEGQLTFCRAKDQKTIQGWKRPQKIS